MQGKTTKEEVAPSAEFVDFSYDLDFETVYNLLNNTSYDDFSTISLTELEQHSVQPTAAASAPAGGDSSQLLDSSSFDGLLSVDESKQIKSFLDSLVLPSHPTKPKAPAGRKWKHLNAEKKRRDLTKDSYNALVQLVKYPRPKETGRSPHTRIPKHVILNYIIEDIMSIVSANEQLESLIRNI